MLTEAELTTVADVRWGGVFHFLVLVSPGHFFGKVEGPGSGAGEVSDKLEELVVLLPGSLTLSI